MTQSSSLDEPRLAHLFWSDRCIDIQEQNLKSVELFTGAGGLALGVANAGFEHAALVELHAHAGVTIKANVSGGGRHTRDWPLHTKDVREFDFAGLGASIDLLAGGVPCQPFSFAGRGLGRMDKRNLFPDAIRAIACLKPKAVLIENVKGLLRSSFRNYFDYLLARFALPELLRREGESWPSHWKRLRGCLVAGTGGVRYDVHKEEVNAADFGVPQLRERVFIVAFRSDLKVDWTPPQPTHSADALLWSQWKTGEYWGRVQLPQRLRPGRMSRRLFQLWERIRDTSEDACKLLPWVTVRESLMGLPLLRQGQRSTDVQGHFLNRGARAYLGHEGSLPDEPAKTLKAGIHGVPGGENSLNLGGTKIRYFSVRECARLQTFPDDYLFPGAWSVAMNQVGNAVPVRLAEVYARSIAKALTGKTHGNVLDLGGFRQRKLSGI